MKILAIHADYVEFEAKKKAFKAAEEGIREGKQRIEECLVVLSSVEKRDEVNPPAVMERYVHEIEDIARQVHTTAIVLYPYAHLSSQLGSPAVAEQLLKDAEKLLISKNYAVTRAPFGWYKAFTLACKGHPLSELSREFSVEGIASASSSGAAPTPSLKRETKDEPFVFDGRELSAAERIMLSGALLVGKAVTESFAEAKIGSLGLHHGQAYVDIALFKFKEDYIPRLEKQVQEFIRRNLLFGVKKGAKLGDLQEEISKDIGKKAVMAGIGDLAVVPLFKNPFIKSAQEIGALKITHAGSAYWKNNEHNQQLVRLYCVAFATQEELAEYLEKQGEAERRSHLKIGKEQGLFVVSELVGQGLPLLAPKGTIIRNEIIKFLWELHQDKGYQQVWTPHIAKDLLYKTSGHWEKFGDELFKVKGKSDDFVMKPMNCPHHMQIFDSFSFSYRDMPVRFFEPATIYRDEKSGQLLGLSRVRAITQDDGHLFCRISQIKQEVQTIVSVIREFYHTLGMDKDYWVSLSVRGEDKSKYLGTDDVWNIAERSLEEAAKENRLPYKKILGEAAFYGPKLDFLFKDSLGREWQLATIQLDFNLPQRFKLSFMNEKSEKEQPVVIHRAISGSLERFMSILIEHFAGKFPAWLSPVQVKILTVTDRNIAFAQDVARMMRKEGLRVEVNDQPETIGKKVREAQLEKVNHIITIGDKECEKKTLAVRTRAGDVTFDVPLKKFVKDIVAEAKERKL